MGIGIWQFVEGVNTAERSETVVARLYPASDPATVVTRVNSTNVLNEGLRIEEIGRRMNSKVKSVKQGVYRK
jgi:hypothetical protein